MEQPFFSQNKLILFDLEDFAPKQPNPTDSQARRIRMKKFDRRQFLKGSAAAAGALSLPAFWLPRSARAAGTGPKKLVLFFLGGGMTGRI